MQQKNIAVVIAAFNAQNTIDIAIRSALEEPETAEVIVVDDASSDHTPSVVQTICNKDDRVKLIVQEKNQGPSAARNVAIQNSSSPLIAILDADDIILPGRFARLLKIQDWDFIADNIAFCENFDQIAQVNELQSLHELTYDDSIAFDLAQFVYANISDTKRVRGELGFLKPVMRRDFLEAHQLKYEESCRLGEDFLFYCYALSVGARLKLIYSCGYAALIRADSLSGQHSLEDLRALHSQSIKLTRDFANLPLAHVAMQKHARSILRRIHHREVLQVKKEHGAFAGVIEAIKKPTAILDILKDRTTSRSAPNITPRLLFTKSDLEDFV